MGNKYMIDELLLVIKPGWDLSEIESKLTSGEIKYLKSTGPHKEKQ